MRKADTRIHTGSSIRSKLTRLIVITSGAALVLTWVMFAAFDLSASRRAYVGDLTTLTDITGLTATAALTFDDAKAGREILNSLSAHPNIVEACIFSRDGRVLAHYVRSGTGTAFIPPPMGRDGAFMNASGLTIFRGIQLNGERIGTIYVKSDLQVLQERRDQFAFIATLAALGSLVAAYLLALRLQRGISEPILELAHAASDVHRSRNYSLRVAEKSDDEIGYLFVRFNEMLHSIQERDTELQLAKNELEARVHERTLELQKEVAERKQTERQLENRTMFLNSLINNDPVAIAAIEESGLVQMCNPAFEKLFGYGQPEILGRSLADLVIDADHRAEATANVQQIFEGRPVNTVTRRMRSDGSLVDVDLAAVPLITEGRVTGTLVLYQDITERKRAAETLIHAKEAAEAASRAKSEFLANMSHEIRTPMNGIMGMTELVLDTDLDPEQRNYLNLAKVSADSLLSLINDVLDYSKIEAGKLEIEAINFSLGDSLGDTMKTLSLRAHQKGLELAFEIEPSVPDGLIGDPGRLRQIIINLVGNGIKFTEQGEVVVYVKSESRTHDRAEIHFTVSDTGIGVPAEKQTSIFQAFNQADGSMTRKYGGTGLGLTISARLVSLMGGRIWVESEPGKGSRFHFTVAFALQQTPMRTVVPRNPESLRDMRVLVVDDNTTNRHILSKMLQNWHMQPTAVESGAKAIVNLGEAQGLGRVFPLVLLDAQMPEMDGFALAECIKRNPDWKAATVMMLSSAGQRGDAMRCRELGVAAYLTKPIRQSELLDAILTALGTRARNNAPDTLITRHSLRENRSHLRILLAEDNAVNQLLALRLLEKHGHTVTTAANGRKTLEAMESGTYDAILMDIQMPEMDGLEATRAIREKEKINGGHIPIVAVTAHAMKGDEERCLSTGMDYYLTKPIRTPELLAVLEKIRNGKEEPDESVDPLLRNPSRNAVDLATALEGLDGDRNLFDELTQLFREDCPRNIEGMRRAIALHDRKSLEHHAHTLRGSSASLGAFSVSQAAAEIERLAQSDNVESTGDQFKVLQEELERLFGELEVLRRG